MYQDVRVSFWFKARGMDKNEFFTLEYSSDGGRTYNEMARWMRGTNDIENNEFDNDLFYNQIVTFSQADLSETAKIQFRNYASGNEDQVCDIKTLTFYLFIF
jgi:hypothetical protein